MMYEYIMIEDENHPNMKINLQTELGKICRFGSLDRGKVIARLEHLQSEARNIITIPCSDIYFERIKETGHEGCGFVPPGKFA